MVETPTTGPDIRQRRPQTTNKSTSGMQEKRNPTPLRYQRAPPPPNRPTRGIHLSLTILILGFFVLYSQRNPLRNKGDIYGIDHKSLPETYGICTKGRQGIYTVPESGGLGTHECVVVHGKEVVDIGSLNRLRNKWGDKATIGEGYHKHEGAQLSGGLKILYLPEGHTMTPGFIDAHGHVLEYGYYAQLPLLSSRSPEEVVSRVESFLQSEEGQNLPEGSWIEGMGWDQNLFPSKSFPTSGDLERSPILKGKRICLARVDVHAEWVSRAVLDELESRPGGLPDIVDGGLIVRDQEGKPTGVFVDNAIDLINEIRPKWSDDQRHRFLKRMADEALSKGLTGVHNARTPKADADFFIKLARSNSLPLRFNLMIYCPNATSYCGDDFPRVSGAGDGRLDIHSVKLFGDGALGSRGAALLEDYSDQPGWKGFMLVPEEKWEGIVRMWYEKGWQVNIHTIGDRANHVVLNAIEYIVTQHPSAGSARRFRLEHAQIMTPADLKRSAKLGVIASYQPTHATSDMWYAEDRLGKDRLNGAYAWQSYLQYGGRIALGSDFPVESLDPLKGFYAATTRLAEDGTSPHGPEGWIASEKLSREQALRGFTVDAAYAGLSNLTGSLIRGKRFDAVIWDDDLMTVPIGEMLQVRVKATIMDGQIVYGKIET